MKIAILGCGAMGSVYAALLGDAGHEVWAIDSWQDHVDAIKKNGLRLEGASGSRVVKINVTNDTSEVGVCDLVIIATKAMHVETAAYSAFPLIDTDTTVLSIQNGLGGPQTAAKILGAEKVAVGVVGGFGASIKEPGYAHHNGWELLRLGELSGPITSRLRTIASTWESGGFRVECFDDIDQLVWEKLICNVCFSGTCTITGLTIGEVMEDSDAWFCASRCAQEAYNIAIAKNINVRINDPIDYVRNFGSKIPGAKPSMLLDALAGRMSEIDAINGAIASAGIEVSVETPFNSVISALVRNKEKQMGVR
jgi:2-dehydropantoate 2-reductase